MSAFISNLIGNDKLATFIMSFIPLIELKGGIIFGWDKLGFLMSFVLAYLGSTLVFIPIFFLLRPILELLKKIKIFNSFAIKVEGYFQKKASDTLDKENNRKTNKCLKENFIKQIGVFIFVAIPLPMTGVWTGTAIAVFLSLKFKETVIPIICGNLVAGLLISGISALCTLLQISLDLVLWILFAMAVFLLLFTIIKISVTKEKD